MPLLSYQNRSTLHQSFTKSLNEQKLHDKQLVAFLSTQTALAFFIFDPFTLIWVNELFAYFFFNKKYNIIKKYRNTT